MGVSPDDYQAVAEAIQRNYKDATQTQLDLQCAADIIKTLRQRGWINIKELAWVVTCAGGKVTLDPALYPDNQTVLHVSENTARGKVLSVDRGVDVTL